MAFSELIVKIGADLSELSRALNTGMSDVQKLGGKFKSVGQDMGTHLGTAGIAVGAGLGVAISKAADFEQALADIKSIAPEVGNNMGAVRDLALEMGAKTKFSATEAANGMEEMIKAGVPLKDIMGGGLKGALDLAVAGQISVADAAEIASTALNTFRADNLSVTQAANILAGGANASATSVGELKYGLSAVGTVAAGAGLSFQDTATALAVFANHGLKGSDAGTSFKTMLANLTPSTKAAATTMSELGIITADGSNKFYNANGSLKSFAEISGVLKTALSGLTDQQRQSALQTMFGSDAIRAGNIVYAEGKAGVEAMWTAMSKTTAADVAKVRLDTLKGAVEQLKGAFDTFLISIGSQFTGALTTLAQWLQTLVDKFNNLSPAMQKMIAFGTAISAGLLLVASAAGFLVMGLGALAAAEWAVIAPVAAVVAALALVAAAFVLLWTKSQTFRTIVTAVFNGIKSVATQVFGAVASYLGQKWSEIASFFNKYGPQIKQAWNNLWKFIGPVVKAAFAVVVIIVKGAWDAIKNVIDGGLKVIKGLIKTFTGLFTGDFKLMWSGIKDIFMGGIQLVWGLVNVMFYGRILKVVGTMAKAIGASIKGMWATIKSLWSAGVNTAKELTSNMGTTIKAAWQSIKSTATTVWNGVKTAITKPIEAAKKTVLKIIDTIKSAFAKMKITIPKPKIPKVSVAMKKGAGGIPYPDFNVNWHKDGGVFNGASVVGLGEAGPEAIVPLQGNRMKPFAEAIAGQMPNGGGSGGFDGVIETYVQLDGRTIARATSTHTDRALRRTVDSKKRARGKN